VDGGADVQGAGSLLRQLAERARAGNQPAAAERYAEQAQLAEQYGDVIHECIAKGAASVPPLPEGPPAQNQG